MSSKFKLHVPHFDKSLRSDFNVSMLEGFVVHIKIYKLPKLFRVKLETSDDGGKTYREPVGEDFK